MARNVKESENITKTAFENQKLSNDIALNN